MPRSASRFLSFLAMLVLALALSACSRKVEFMAAMPEPEANEVLAALQNAGIPADKVPGKEGMVGVTVAADQVGRAVDLLREKGLPRERFAGMGQVFRKEGLISSPLEERARYLYALSQELGATITQIDGVIVARVHIVLPERGSAGDAAVPAAAAVFIKHQEGYNLDTVQPLVRRLVTNSIPGLSPEKVSIILVNAQPRPQVAAGGAPAGPARPAAQAPTDLRPLVGVLAALLLATAGAASFLGWKYWWPQRRARAGAADTQEAGA